MKQTPILKLFLFFFFIFQFVDGFPQDETKLPIFFSLNYRTGENVPHRPVVKNLTYPYRGVDLKIGWQTLGAKDWQRAFRYPSLGVGVNWNTFKTDVLGEPVAVYFFTNFPQFSTSWCRLDLEVDLGMSYGINPYNEKTNPTNFSTGTTVNTIFGLYLEQSFHITPQIDLFACEGLSHYSNGALGYPNIGLNIPSLKFGVRYLCDKPEYIKNNEKLKYNRNFSIVTYLGGGTKKMDSPTPSYNEILISPSLFYRTGFKRRVGLGFEAAYNQAIMWQDKYTNPDKEYTFGELMTYSVHLSHEFIISRFTLLSQFGIYLKNQPTNKFYFERIGFGYYIGKNVRVVLNIKAHYIKAEYVEAGIAYDLNLN
jgi:hypothetical protein